MDYSYSLEASFVSARRNSTLDAADAAALPGSSRLPKYPIMDLNDVTREFERYQRKLSTLGMANIGEVLKSPVTVSPASSKDSVTLDYSLWLAGSGRTVELPDSSKETIRAYELALKRASRAESI